VPKNDSVKNTLVRPNQSRMKKKEKEKEKLKKRSIKPLDGFHQLIMGVGLPMVINGWGKSALFKKIK